MNIDNYDQYDKTIAEWYDRVVSSGYHNQSHYIDELLHIIPEGSSALELGCGTGEIMIPLIKKGRMIEGIDKSSDMLAKLHLGITHVVTYPIDARNFTPKAKYDYVFSCNGVFSIKSDELESYLLEEEEVRDCLKRYITISRNGLLISKGTDKNSLKLALNGEEFVHREIREGDIMVMIHFLFKNSNLIGERTHVKRRYRLEKILGKNNFRNLTENFYSITL